MASFVVYGDTSGQVTVAAPAVAGSNTITFPAETGTLVTTAYTGAALPGQINWNTSVQTSGFTAVKFTGYFCNTTGGAFTVTLPATPTRGDFVVIVDYAGTAATNNITVSGNGANINGGSGNVAIGTNRQGLTLTYIDSTQGWLATSNVYKTGYPFINYPISYLVVAGGGGGGNSGGGVFENGGGGGGAGGYQTGTVTLNIGTVYTATIGSGGASNTIGNNSVLSGTGLTTVTSIGGGKGGTPTGATTAGNGGNGGSGGGGAGSNVNTGSGGTGTSGQGNNGGTSSTGQRGTGGGGGAGSIGGDGPVTGPSGSGGVGSASSITGSSVTYAGGGGGGGGGIATGGSGGSGGGGNGSTSSNGSAGTVNLGGGGGGAGGGGSSTTGGAGGSGVVIISVPTVNYTGTVTGSPTVTTSGLNTIIRFTSTGTYTA